MRLLHTSDWHLGRTLHGVDLLDAQRAVLQQIIDLVADPPDGVPVDTVLIAGDVYDRAVPPVDAVALFSAVLAELCRHASVIVTGGNHDSAIRLGFGAELFTDRLHVHTRLDGIGTPVLLGDVAIYPLPYLDPDAARTLLADGDEPLERSHQAVMAAAMDSVRADLAAHAEVAHSIVVAHAFVVGGQPSESERSIAVGGVDSVAAGTFDGVDYVALGHLHGPQQPTPTSSTLLRYSGSPLRYSFSERGQRKSVTLVDLDSAGVRITEVPLEQPRAMADLVGELDELLGDAEFTGHADDWVRITVTDRQRPEQLYDRLKNRYPHLLQFFHIPAGTPADAAAAQAALAQRSPRELGQQFLSYVTRLEATEDELDAFEAAYREATLEIGRAGS